MVLASSSARVIEVYPRDEVLYIFIVGLQITLEPGSRTRRTLLDPCNIRSQASYLFAHSNTKYLLLVLLRSICCQLQPHNNSISLFVGDQQTLFPIKLASSSSLSKSWLGPITGKLQHASWKKNIRSVHYDISHLTFRSSSPPLVLPTESPSNTRVSAS